MRLALTAGGAPFENTHSKQRPVPCQLSFGTNESNQSDDCK